MLRSALLTLTIGTTAALTAGTVIFEPKPGTGPAVPVMVTIQDVAGGVSINTKVTGLPAGDIVGMFWALNGNTLPGSLTCAQITGPDITGCQASEGTINSLGGGVTMNGVYTTFDVGVNIGTPGIGGNDIQNTTLELTNSAITASLFEVFGVRLTSVGAPGERTLSSKLIDYSPERVNDPTPNPEPATFGIAAAGLALLYWSKRRG